MASQDEQKKKTTQQNSFIKMTIAATRPPGWDDATFLHEYTTVHANMTRHAAAAVPTLRKYTQLVVVPTTTAHAALLPPHNALNPDAATATTCRNNQQPPNRPWDAVSTLEWTTLADLQSSLQTPVYRASAGHHRFTDAASQVGILSREVARITFDSAAFDANHRDNSSSTLKSDLIIVVVFLRRRPPPPSSPSEQQQQQNNMKRAGTHMETTEPSSSWLDDDNHDDEEWDLAGRVASIETIARQRRHSTETETGTGLLRYVLNTRVTPEGDDAKAFFAGTPFADSDWVTTEAMEQYWFPNREAAASFLRSSSEEGEEEELSAGGVMKDLFLSSSLATGLRPRSGTLSFAVVGREIRVVDKDGDGGT